MPFLRLLVDEDTALGNGPPVDATSGVPLRRGKLGQVAGEGMPDDVDEVNLLAYAVVTAAGAGAVDYLKLWGYAVHAPGDYKWFPLGTASADDDRGKLNGGNALGEIATADDVIVFSERITGLADFDRVYLEYGPLTAIDSLDATIIAAGIRRAS